MALDDQVGRNVAFERWSAPELYGQVQNGAFGFVGFLPTNSTGLAGRSLTMLLACAFNPQPSFFLCLTFLIMDIQLYSYKHGLTLTVLTLPPNRNSVTL